MRVLKIGTKVNYKGDEYTIKSIRSIDCGFVTYDVRGSGLKQLLTNYELGDIEDPRITIAATECWYYSFKDDILRENMAYAIMTLTGKHLIYCPTVRRVLEDADFNTAVGKNFDIVMTDRDLEYAKELIVLAMNDRVSAA